MEEVIVCSCCGAVLHPEDAISMNDEILCESCAEDNTFICDCCNERFYNSNDYGNSETHLCQNCLEEHYTVCERCGDLISRSEAHYAEDDDYENYPYCQDCFERYVDRYIHNYYYKPDPIFYGEGPLFLGVELEVDEGGKDNENAHSVLDIMNRDGEHAYMKGDGSLDDGMELVSHPCSLAYHLEQMPWEAVLQEFRRMGYYSHSTGTCGLHVHVSRAGLGKTQAVQEDTIGKLLYLFERFWQEVLKFSRRTESQMNRWAARYGYKNSGREILETAKNADSGRYSCINLTNYSTVEFRAFRGTLKYNTFCATLQFVANLCKVAVSFTEDALKAMCWADLVTAITGDDTPELIQYLKERGLYINEPVATESEV